MSYNCGPLYLNCQGDLCSGELERAARCIQMVLDKDPNHPGALINFGALLLRKYGSTFAGVFSSHFSPFVC